MQETLDRLAEREHVVASNGIEIAYDEFGNTGDPAMLLVMGLGMQLVAWDERFCETLVARGYRVIRFDNRDVGHSTKLDSRKMPGRAAMLTGTGRPAYLLSDMAADAVGLLDHLGIERAHVVGVSMGGMICQTMAIEHRQRVHSIASVMSSTGSRWFRMPKWRAMVTLMAKPPSDADAYMDLVTRTFEVIGSPRYPMAPERFRELMQVSYRRSFYPPGVARQLHAINCSGNRARRLRRLDLPALVVHGGSDPLIRPAAGRATARAIPEARLKMIEGMGHDLPEQLWPEIVDAIDANARRGGVKVGTAA